jgi:hypothetical protein
MEEGGTTINKSRFNISVIKNIPKKMTTISIK